MSPDKRYWRKVDSDPQHHYSGCVGKVKYPSKHKAAAKREDLMWEAPDWDSHLDKKNLEAYKCKCCGSWHLGHPSPNVLRQRELARQDERIITMLQEARI